MTSSNLNIFTSLKIRTLIEQEIRRHTIKSYVQVKDKILNNKKLTFINSEK